LIVAVLIISATGLNRLYIEHLWFESLGFDSVYWYGIKAQSVLFGVMFILTTALLWVIFRLIISVGGEARQPFLEIQGRIVSMPSVRSLKKIGSALAVLLGILIGLMFSSQWETYALYLNQPSPQGLNDPIFGRPVEFFLFTLPAVASLTGWLTVIAGLAAAAAIGYFVLGMTNQLRGISLAVSLVLAVFAFRTFVGRYSILLNEHSLFSGASYVDDHVLVNGLLATSIALLAGAVMASFNAAGRLRNIVIAVAIPGVVHLVVGAIVPWYVTTFVVKPNELVRETPYIRHNIEFTRKAFGLDRVEELPFEPRMTGAGIDPNAHRTTLDNMRLWDWKALQDTLRQIQAIRTYYDFSDVDIDRYAIGGKLTGTMLATREIDINKLPAGSRGFVNDRLNYTHGYGVVMNSASRFTREGLPQFILSNMPVESTEREIQVKRPEIYFGELTNWPVYGKTGQKEFNFPQGDANNTSTYEGTGGIRMGSLIRRLLLAYEVGDLLTVPFSDDVTADSVLMFRRNIIDRASRLAPFLTFDSDPYMVVGEDGALYWILDAYTSSGRYPYSRHLRVGNRPVNYMRNSVKAVIDAYNGSVTFYVFDPDDALIQAYQRLFPSLFQQRSAMPEFLMKHVRYPELFFQIQAMMYSSYHVENEQVFYNREDVWTIAEMGSSQPGSPSGSAIEPYFILMNFPGEPTLEFVSILPFTPSKRNNLIGWMAARSDGANYGKLRAYHLPKTRQVDGPLQIQAKIDQDPQLSSQLTLWNQQGSAVIRGNLLAIPIEDTLLYAEPIYLQAQRSPMPALRLIVLATQDRLAYATSFEEALKLLLEGRSGSLALPVDRGPDQPSGQPAATSSAPGRGAPSASVEALIARASRALADYQRLTAEGRLAEAGAKLEELKTTLEQLNKQR
jgi:uncharacterized membrane protein (UPF0182 family)